MISRIAGQISRVTDDHLRMQVDALEYTILIPEFVRRQLQSKLGKEAQLFTIQYLEAPSPNRMIPRMVGFQTEVEREFFELFCSVDGVGAKKALRAMVRPVRDVAIMIEEQDVKGLSSLPGIGAATAERIVAKLRRKMSKFALMVAAESAPDLERDIVNETYQVLRELGHTETESRHLIDEAIKGSKKKFKDPTALLQAIYDRNR